ncbi:MAG: methyltransferase [Caulobacteraceae bacterium]|nr:methyltransferase [Caulobacteraceae bacterium]
MTTFDRRRFVIASALAAPSLAVTRSWADAPSPAPPSSTVPETVLAWAIESSLRSPAAKARDVWRHPMASLKFWGLAPGQTVIDVSPGSGWWTDIIAPYLRHTGGHYIAAVADLNDPKLSAGARKGRATFEAKYATAPDTYGDVRLVGFGAASGPLAPAGSVDLVLVSRETHNWTGNGFTQKAFGDFRAALKPGGVLAIEDHRAPDGADPNKGDGYISEAYVIDQAKMAGFELAARSEINANPKDTKDHPFGVWTLPPTRQSAPDGQPPNPAFDHSRYDAIGESDRMTLKFVKPA